MMAAAVIKMAREAGVGDIRWAMEWKVLGNQGESAYPSCQLLNFKRIVKFTKMLSRPMDQVSWDLYKLNEAVYYQC